jgi:beta-glucanase (GH16 family)
MVSSTSDSGDKKGLTRRQILGAGALGAGAIIGGGYAYSVATRSSTPAEPAIERSTEFSAEPAWTQDFADMKRDTLDVGIWHYETHPDVPSYNNELQGYTEWADNVRIESGVGLVIEAHTRDYQYPNDPQARQYKYTSGRVDTIGSFTFDYGKLEGRMKLPAGRGVWPAFWLLSANEVNTVGKDFSEKEYENERFYMRNGEIDIMEYYGNNPGFIEGTVHTYTDSYAKTLPADDATEVFHTYGIELTPTSLVWTFDDEAYFSFEKTSDDPEVWPFSNGNELYVILNLALGGPAGPVEDRRAPWRFEIEHLRYYEYTGKR